MQSDTSISYILSNNIFTKVNVLFLSPDHIFIGGQFENQEVNLTNGDCNGKWRLRIKSFKYHFLSGLFV